METKATQVEWKADAADPNVMKGYASTFGGPPDSYGDIIDKGAYTKTIKERIEKGKVALCDGHNYDAAHTIGLISEGVEDSTGLKITAKMSKAPDVQNTIIKMKEGIISGLSIGYDVIQEMMEKMDGRWIRHLKEIRLREISITPIPACDTGRITSVKNAMPYEDLDFAPADYFWAPDLAMQRVKNWADSDRGPNPKFKKAFLGFNAEQPNEFGACLFQFADVIDGQLKAVPRAICTLALEMKNEDSPAREHLGRYLLKMGYTPLWKAPSIDEILWKARAGIIDKSEIDRAIGELKAVAEAGPGNPPPTEATKTVDSLSALEKRAAKLGERFKC